MDVDLMMMMVDYGCRIYAMAPGDELHVAGYAVARGARDELMMCRSGGASVESLQSWGAALYAMAPGSRLHDSHWRSGWKDRYTNLASRDDETGRSLSEMETGRSLSEMMRPCKPFGGG